MSNYKKIAFNLKHQRDKYNLSRSKAILMLKNNYGIDISVNRLRELENGKRLPRIDEIDSLAKLYNINPLKLTGWR